MTVKKTSEDSRNQANRVLLKDDCGYGNSGIVD